MANYTIKNNIDYYTGWVVDRSSFEKGDAHSGNKYISLVEKNTYGPRYRIKIDELVSLNKVNVEFYARSYTENTKALYVLQIQRGDSNIYWKSFKLNNVVLEPKKWMHVKTSFDFSKINVEPDDVVSLYPWLTTIERVDFDDFSIEFL